MEFQAQSRLKFFPMGQYHCQALRFQFSPIDTASIEVGLPNENRVYLTGFLPIFHLATTPAYLLFNIVSEIDCGLFNVWTYIEGIQRGWHVSIEPKSFHSLKLFPSGKFEVLS